MGARLDEILSRRASPVVYYYQAYDYTAFGEEELFSHQKQFLLFDRKISQPYGFTGRPKEELTGLYYYRYRDYNPQTGRFLQPDPLGQLPGPNIYSYCQNNPVNWVDPWGMEVQKTWNSEEEKRNAINNIINQGMDNWQVAYNYNPTWGEKGYTVSNLTMETVYGNTDIDWALTLERFADLTGIPPDIAYIFGKDIWSIVDSAMDPDVSIFDHASEFYSDAELNAIKMATDLWIGELTFKDCFKNNKKKE